jgi:hypothetical protein
MLPDEEQLIQIDATRQIGFLGGTSWSPLILTTVRLLWKPNIPLLFDRPLNIHLSDILRLDEGKRFDWLRGGSGKHFGVTLKSGKRHIVYTRAGDSEREAFFAKLTEMTGGKAQ